MKAPEYKYNAIVEKVVDGDTIDCLVDLGFNTSTTVRFRIISSSATFDTPETWRPKTESEKNMASKLRRGLSNFFKVRRWYCVRLRKVSIVIWQRYSCQTERIMPTK